MSLKEKKVVQTITVCDFCDSDIASADLTTHVEASTSGFMKRDSFEFDLCENCASTLGLKRRGRKPAEENKSISSSSSSDAPRRKRGRPSKAELAEREAQANASSASNDGGWEYQQAESAG